MVMEDVKQRASATSQGKPFFWKQHVAFDSHHPICHKKSVAKTLIGRAGCLPSSLDSKAEKRKDVCNVLTAND